MRGRCLFFLFVMCGACKTDPPRENATPTKVDPLDSCIPKPARGSTKWSCPNDVVALDISAKVRHEQPEITLNLEKFAEPFLEMGAKRDDTDLVVGATHYRSVKVAGAKQGAGPFVSRMVAIDQEPTRYVSCAAKEDACDDVLKALVEHGSTVRAEDAGR